MVNLQEYYDKALTTSEYRETLTTLEDGFNKIYDEHEVVQDQSFEDFKNSGRKLLVIAEP